MKEIKEILKTYNRQREALLPCLHFVQKKYGRLSEEMATFLARQLDLPPAEVYSVASFYSMFGFKKKARYIIRICVSLPCYLKGSSEILKVLRQELKIASGKVSPDKRFAIEAVSCLGCCDKAPVMLVNQTRYENLTARRVREIIRSYKRKKR
jgi:NADH-quinone oxidoreductase E subunit